MVQNKCALYVKELYNLSIYIIIKFNILEKVSHTAE